MKYLYKLLLTVFLFFPACQSSKTIQQIKNKQSSVTTKYKIAADYFYLMDQVGQAIPKFFLIKDYLDFWQEKFELSEYDKDLLQKYRTLRNKYIKINDMPGFGMALETVKNTPKNLFAPAPNFIEDPIAFAFFSSDSIDQALEKIKNIISQEEHKFIHDFFEYFIPKIQQIISLNSGKKLQEQIKKQNDFLSSNKVITHLESIRKFYNSTTYDSEALIVWRPANGGFCASCYGPYIIIQLSPEILPLDQNLFMIYMGVVMHEATHAFSCRASKEQKLRLTKTFMDKCKKLTNLQTTPSYGLFTFIEEPLVQILSQALFFKKYFSEYFDFDNCGYNHPLVKLYFKDIEEYFYSNKSLDDKLIVKLANKYANNKTN
jgi:hypothetical protein